MPSLEIYRKGIVVLTPKYSQAEYNGQVMGENKISVAFKSHIPVDLRIGDYILHRTRKYTLSDTPSEDQPSDKPYVYYSYQMFFEAPEYRLYNKKFRQLNSGTFPFTGTAKQMLTLIVQVAGSEWAVGTVADTEIKTIQFERDSCRSAITKVAQLFDLEYEFRNDGGINMIESVGSFLPNVVLSFGKNRGLKGLSRQPIANDSFGTRFYGYGSSENLPAGYRGGATQLQFEGFYVDSPLINNYPEPIEQDIEFPDIKPERTGTVTAVSATATGWSVTDTSLDFNLNDVIVDGSAKIVFKSGPLNGNEFEITAYDNATKTISFNANTEDSGYVLPNATVKAAIGNTYTLIGIVMPQSYINTAEAKLKAATVLFAGKNDKPKINYGLKTDKLYLKQNNLTQALSFGNKIRVVDSIRGIDTILRIQQISYPLNDEAEIEATITDTVMYTIAENTIETVKNTEIIVKQESRINYKRARERDISLRALQGLIVDPDGNYYTEKIKPGSIETLHLAVGSKYTNFTLKNVVFKVNTNGNPNAFSATRGDLVHFSMQIDGVGFIWQMNPYSTTTLTSANSYYVYAKISQTALTGEWILDTNVRKVDYLPGYWYLQTGVLFAVNTNGVRDYEFTKGMAYIVGDQITAGVLKSLDGLNYFNLNDGSFNLGDEFSGIDWNVTTPDQLSIHGTIDARTATFINLIVQNVITGKVKITAANNNIVIENTSKEGILILDDDCALEGYTLNTQDAGHPQIVPLYGPGIRVGLSPNNSQGFSSMSRKGFFSNFRYTAGGNGKGIIFDRDGFTVNSGKRTVSGQFLIPAIGGIQEILKVTVENGFIVGWATATDTVLAPMTVNAPQTLIVDTSNDTNYISPSAGTGTGGGTVDPPTDPNPTPTPPTYTTFANTSTLKGALTDYTFPIGVAVKDNMYENVPYGDLAKTYERITCENAMKFGRTQPTETTFNWQYSDKAMQFAKDNGLKVHWHAGVWAANMPKWYTAYEGTISAEVALQKLENHMDKFLDRYLAPEWAGIIVSCDVGNEPFNDNGTWKDSATFRMTGSDGMYIARCVKRVNARAPQILTFVNDYGQEYGSTAKTNALINLKNICSSIGARLDGIGMQMHTVMRITISLFQSRMKLISDAGLMVHVSELDVELHRGLDNTDQGAYPFLTPQIDADAAIVWRNIFNACLTVPANKFFGITTWSLGDADNYINSSDNGGLQDYPGLRYLDYTPKPALTMLVSRAIELKNPKIYDNFRLSPQVGIEGRITKGSAAVSWSAGIGFGLQVTAKGLQAQPTGNATFSFGLFNISNINFTMVVGLSDLLTGHTANKNVVFTFRHKNSTNFFFFRPRNATTDAFWCVGKKINDVDTILFKGAADSTPNDIATIVVNNDVMTFYVNGVFQATFTDTTFTGETTAGVRMRGDRDTVSAVDFIAVDF